MANERKEEQSVIDERPEATDAAELLAKTLNKGRPAGFAHRKNLIHTLLGSHTKPTGNTHLRPRAHTSSWPDGNDDGDFEFFSSSLFFFSLLSNQRLISIFSWIYLVVCYSYFFLLLPIFVFVCLVSWKIKGPICRSVRCGCFILRESRRYRRTTHKRANEMNWNGSIIFFCKCQKDNLINRQSTRSVGEQPPHLFS